MPIRVENASLAEDSNRPRHIAIIGSGIVGASLAHEFSGRGVRVTVLTSEKKGETTFATSKSFAWMNSQAFFRAVDPIPENEARHYFGLHRLGIGAWQRLHLKLGEDLGTRWHGTLQWTDDEDEDGIGRLNEELRRRQAWGSPAYAVDRDDVCALLPGARIKTVGAGFYGPDEAAINPFAATNTLLRAAVETGGEIIWNCTVQEFDEVPNGKVTVRHSLGDSEFDEVIIAAGRQSPELADKVGIDIPLVETSGDILHLDPLPFLVGPLVYSPDLHIAQRSDGRIVLAKHFTGALGANEDRLDQDQLLRTAIDMFPSMQQARIEKVTSGRRILPSDGLPIIGQSDQFPAVRSVTTNAGITLGPILAQLVATEVIDGVDTEILDRYRSTRFAR